MYKRSRRQFLEDSMFATAAAYAATSAATASAEDKKKKDSPNEKLNVAVIGVRGRGGSHIGGFAGKSDSQVTYICDPDEQVGKSRAAAVAKKQGGKAPKFVRDMREVFDDPSVDVVTCATPNHWHALCSIWAMQAGKDVYVEKPVSHNVSEGRRIVEAARKYKRICQTGTQSRSMSGMQQFIQFVQDGGIGKVTVGRGLCYKRRGSIGKLDKPLQIPSYIDYDLWCGPAEKVDLHRPKLHYDWHWDFNTGNGDLGNQGIHQMDLARWGLNLDRVSDAVISYGGRFSYTDAGNTANTQVVVNDYGDKTLVFEVRGLNTGAYRGAKIGVIFEGSEGYAVCPSYSSGTAFDKDGKVIKKFSGGGNHFSNFVKAVKSRKVEDLNADILQGHLSSALCHLGNISYLLGSEVAPETAIEQLAATETKDNDVATFERFQEHLAENKVKLAETKVTVGPKLAIDAKAETFVKNDQADALLTRSYRAPFIVPPAGKV